MFLLKLSNILEIWEVVILIHEIRSKLIIICHDQLAIIRAGVIVILMSLLIYILIVCCNLIVIFFQMNYYCI